MILIVSVCKDELSELEFVRPVERLVGDLGIEFITRRFREIDEHNLIEAEKVIICGTALMDFGYLDGTNEFSWLRRTKKPVLGICAGYQIIAKIFGNELAQKVRIGRFKVNLTHANKLTTKKTSYSYFLSTNTAKIEKCFEILAVSGNLECMIKHASKDIYGCLFHPENLNPEIITSFCRLLQKA